MTDFPHISPAPRQELSPYIHLFRRYLRQQNLPVTQQREVVADVVFNSSEHLSVEDIEAQLRSRGERIGKATIYRTMEILVRSGLVVEHDFGEGFKRYEHLFGQQPEHEHLICTHCGHVTEFQRPRCTASRRRSRGSTGSSPRATGWRSTGSAPGCQAAGVTVAYHGLTCPALDVA
jgi:Fur family ferric uptake transcriptional regulator